MLDGLFVTPAVTAIEEAFSGLGPRAIAVVGNAKLATALATATRSVIPVGLTPRAAKKVSGAIADTTALEPRALDAVVGVDIATDDAWRTTLAGWTRVVRDGGVVVLVDRGHAADASLRALCAGLMELEQRTVGRLVITSGVVTHFSV